MANPRNDPFPAFRFELSLDDLPVAGFSEIGGLSIELESQEYAEGGVNNRMWKFPHRAKQANLTLKRGIVDRMLWEWFHDLTLGKVKFRNGAIRLRDPSGGQVIMEWYIYRAFPTKWSGPDLNATQNNVAVESLELAHHGLERRQ